MNKGVHPLLRRGEFGKLNTLNDWGGLMISERNDKECDATDDKERTESRNKNIF